MSEHSSTASVYDSPVRLLSIIAASVFVSEALVMIILIILPPLPHVVAAPFDAALVTILIFPILYRFVVRPMTQHIHERRQAEAALRRIQDDLEVRVHQRTAELAEANETLQVQIIERQHAEEELKVALDLVQRRQAEMAGLLTGARAVLEYRDFKGVAQAIFVACRSTIGAAAGYVALPNEDQSNETPVFLDLGEQAGPPEVMLQMPVVGLRQQAYTTGKTVYTNDPDSCECTEWLPGRHMPLSSILFAPLTIKGFIVGTLGLANKPGGFSDDDAQLAAAFAELAAIAVLNSQTIGLLESSERRFRTLAQATFEGIAISEGEFIREVNEQFAHMHGYHRSEVIGKSVADFLAPQDHERMRQVVAGDEVYVGEYQALRKDGSLFLLEVRTYSMEQGGRLMRVAALRDITERKLAEEAIRARNALLSSIIESPDSAIFSIDREYCYTCFNRQHARIMKALWGVDIEIGRNLLEYYTVADDRQTTKQRLDRALSGESFVIEDWAGDDLLPRRCFEIAHNPVKDADQIIGASIFAQDVTERKYADQVLRENEEWLRLAFDAGDLGRWRYVVASNMIHFDERARVHSGSDDNIMAQADVLTHIHPDDRALLQEEVASALNPIGHGRSATEFRVCWPDGETHWLAVQARVHFEGEGEARQPVLAVGISQDITARKRMEAALRESRSDLDRAQEVGQIGSWRLDVRRNVLTWSDENHRIFGVPLDTAMTYDTFLGSVHPDDRDAVDRRWAAGLAGEPYDIEHRIIVAGEIKWVREKAYLEIDRDGVLLGGFGITQDITERKRIEEQLRATLESIGDGFFACDADWRFVYVNAPAERILGIRRENVLGKNYWDVFPLTAGTNLEREYRRAAAGEIRDFENFYEPWDRWFHNRCYPRADGGMSVYFEDITARKQTEDRVKWLATFPELNPSPVVEVDLSGSVDYLNPAAKRLLPDLETEGQTHPWLADLTELGPILQAGDTTVLTREIAFGNAVYQQTLYYVPDAQRVRIYAVDLTARKRAEVALRESEEKYRLLFENLAEGFALYELVRDEKGNPVDWRILEVNTAYTKHTGIARATIVGKCMSELFPAAIPEYLPRFTRVVAEQVPIDFETFAKAVDRFQYVMTFPAGGDRFASVIEDITDRKRTEESLRRQAALIDLSPDGIIMRRVDGTITFWSRGAETLYGWKESEVLGRQVSDLLQARLPQPLEHIVEQLQQTGRWSGEIVHHTRNGVQLIVQSWWLAQFDAQGDITEILESNVDFTIRKQIEEQLRHTQLLLEKRVLERTAELAAANAELRLQSAALQAAANGIIITDRQGNIQWANSAFAKMTGYPIAESLGQNVRLLNSGEQSPEFYRRLWETILSGRVWQGELVNRRKDGSLYVEEQTIAPVLVEPDQIANFIAVKQDVTERKRAEARLTQNNRDLLALGNAERRARQIAETLSAANLALTQSLDLETVMETLLDYVYQLVPYDSANIMLLETEERLVVRAARGYERWTDSQLTRAISFEAHSTRIFRELLSTRKSVLIPQTSAHSDWIIRPGAEHVSSWIGIPIVAGGNVIGVYSLDKATPGFFTNEHVRLAEALVGQAAVAIQNAWLFDQLRAGRERLQSLSRRLVEVQEAERHYVARELHDEAGQALTSLVYGLGALERETVPAQRALRLAELKKTTHEVLENLHHLAMDLRPASLDFLGLVPALNQYVKATGERYGLNAQFKVIGLAEERLPAAMETALYRIVQEALTNVIRHAQATRIDVLLERRDNHVVLVIEDNGSGFEANLAMLPQTGHLGLVGMQERAEMLNGSLVLESTPGSGTTIVVEVPFAHSDSHRR